MKRKLDTIPPTPSLKADDIAERLRTQRKKHKLIQEDLAEMFGITRSGYASMETGRHFPSLPYIVLLQEFYAKKHNDYRSMDWWIYGKDPGVSQSESMKELSALKEENKLLKSNIVTLEKLVRMYETNSEEKQG